MFGRTACCALMTSLAAFPETPCRVELIANLHLIIRRPSRPCWRGRAENLGSGREHGSAQHVRLDLGLITHGSMTHNGPEGLPVPASSRGQLGKASPYALMGKGSSPCYESS